MTIEIKVGPPVITISQGRTFMVTDQRGFINTDSDEGVYAIDTRFVCQDQYGGRGDRGQLTGIDTQSYR